MKAVERNSSFFKIVLFIMQHKMVLTFESVNGILKCVHSNESYRAVVLFIMLHRVARTFES